MEFFADTAETKEIAELIDLGLIDGITTNPSLIRKSGRDVFQVLSEICQMVKGSVSAEVVGLTAEEMVSEGRRLAEIASNITIKVPLTLEGLKACKILSSEGRQVNVTLCFSSNQALLAAKAGATYISPFIGRLDDLGMNGMELIEDIRIIYDNYDFDTKILAASIRSPLHVRDSALAGADVVTVPPAIIKKLAQHPLTDKGLESFLADWDKTGMKIV
ncbi:MAG: fructose-6-phosphate aldolase [Paracoccaceae bacterium]|nr:fructose-6-phosphate aldolase [Paracoccaceae bacterium]MCY4100624.1 fructose-6-phosphate aldolase [Paracoccaceae bacterium]MDE2675851.1 fructose-6-phosphate aldolase [Paracoccaceae bacterium]MXZ50456.1 fructose-6-phosphate aldolase [Paracoccaceae bacterium]MYF44944.1 fructose-6-phosphate aldolase [Paracoccaceae bacterium]